MNVLLCVTGSVASIYTNRLLKSLVEAGHEINVVSTNNASFFNKWQTNIDGGIKYNFYIDSDEWKWREQGDSILHIELRNWADCLVIAPLSINTLAKISNGICDNLVTSIVRAWDYGKPLIVCPSGNTTMWENDPTQEQVETLQNRGFIVLNPIVKTLACGDTGIGAMCQHETIVNAIESTRWGNPLDKKLFVPTGEHPGAFGVIRKNYIHTGVDLYCNDGDPVYAMEDGVIIGWFPFTGPIARFPKWENTDCVMIAGKSGTILYGEVSAVSKQDPMLPVRRGEHIANVKRVLKFGKECPDIPHHSLSMLHLELYRHGTKSQWSEWKLDEPKNRLLLNPTSRLSQVHTPLE